MTDPTILTIPFQLGLKAYAKGIASAAYDTELMTWLQQNESGTVGSSLPHLKEWVRGYNSAVDAECERILSTN